MNNGLKKAGWMIKVNITNTKITKLKELISHMIKTEKIYNFLQERFYNKKINLNSYNRKNNFRKRR